MPQSLVKLLAHVTFSSKDRAQLVTPSTESALFGYSNGIVVNNNSKLIVINGTMDHVHLLLSLGKTLSISELVGDIKRDSSKWIKTQAREFRNFHWQEGYGAFSIGQSQVKTVERYIANQKAHHSKRTFKTEFRQLLAKYEMEYDERYVWD